MLKSYGKILKLILLLTLLTISATTASARTWTLKNGDTIDGSFHRIEGHWIIIKTDNGNKRPINFADLSKDDRSYTENLASIFGSKPPSLEATDPATRVQTGKKKTSDRKKKKHSINLNTLPDPDTEPELKPEPAPAPESKPEPKPEPAPIPEKTKAPAKIDIQAKPTQQNKINALREPQKFVKHSIQKTNFEHLAAALDKSLSQNKYITMYFLALCLLIIIHKMHMPHLYKGRFFRPQTAAPRETQVKEFSKDDNRERFRECPFCKLTNPTSAEKCEHCGQFIK